MPEGLIGLRIAGGIIAVIMVIWAARQFRRHQPGRGTAFLALISGFVLATIAIIPDAANIPTELLSLNRLPAGRMITVLVLSSLALWMLVLWSRYRIAYLSSRADRLLRALAVQTFFRNPELPEGAREAIWTVIPAYDEEENLREVLPQIPRTVQGRDVKVLVVNDGSSDRTGAVARSLGAFVVEMPINVGQGTAQRAGFDTALALGAQYVVTMDADGQNVPAEMTDLVEPILNDEADVVIGSRILGHHEHTSVARTVGVPLFNSLISLLVGKRLSDCASNFRALSADVLRQVVLTQEQYQSAEILIEVAKRDFRIIERPINWKRRIHGHTKKGESLVYGAFFLRTILKTWMR